MVIFSHKKKRQKNWGSNATISNNQNRHYENNGTIFMKIISNNLLPLLWWHVASLPLSLSLAFSFFRRPNLYLSRSLARSSLCEMLTSFFLHPSYCYYLFLALNLAHSFILIRSPRGYTHFNALHWRSKKREKEIQSTKTTFRRLFWIHFWGMNDIF